MMEYNKYGAYHNYMAITACQPHFTVLKWYSGNVVILYRTKVPWLGQHQHHASAASIPGLIWAWELELELGAA